MWSDSEIFPPFLTTGVALRSLVQRACAASEILSSIYDLSPFPLLISSNLTLFQVLSLLCRALSPSVLTSNWVKFSKIFQIAAGFGFTISQPQLFFRLLTAKVFVSGLYLSLSLLHFISLSVEKHWPVVHQPVASAQGAPSSCIYFCDEDWTVGASRPLDYILIYQKTPALLWPRELTHTRTHTNTNLL